VIKPPLDGPLTAEERALVDEAEEGINNEIAKGGHYMAFGRHGSPLTERTWRELERRFWDAGYNAKLTGNEFAINGRWRDDPLTAEERALADEAEKEIDVEIEKHKGWISFPKSTSKLPERVWKELAQRYSDAGWSIENLPGEFHVKGETRRR
jgi:hypothetical protein